MKRYLCASPSSFKEESLLVKRSKTAKCETFPEKSITAMMNYGCSFALSKI